MQYLVRCYVYHESKQAGPWDSRRSPSHPTMGALTLRVWVTLSVFIGFWKFKLSFSYFLGKWFIHWTLSPAPSFISQYKSSFHFYIQKGGRLFSIQYYFCLNMQPCSLIQSSNGCLLRTHYTIHSGREGKDEIRADYTAAIFSSIEDLYRIKSEQMNMTPTSCIFEAWSSISYIGTISQWSWGWYWTLILLPLLSIVLKL